MWPTISNISGNIANTIKSYANDNLAASGLNAWVRVYSGAKSDKGAGLILESNTDFKIFSSAGESGGSIYGNAERSGTIGRTWNGGAVVADVGRVLRPSPIITTLNSKEGQDQISRTCDFSITCFSLEQLELIQTYFMEPGYSVGVEWGWNTGNSAKGLVNTAAKQDGILNQIADVTLNNGQLSSKRLFTNGEYDIFLGFIIGSTISSEGENFKVDVKLRGAPSLPTYLQSQNRITIKSSGIEPDPDKSKLPYSENELASTGDSETEAKKRRFKYMFNELPAFRQTESVKKLIDKATAFDFINFDKVIQLKIDEFYQSVDALPPSDDDTELRDTENIVVSTGNEGEQINVPVPKESLFSTNKYIRFGLAIDILNEIGTVDKYEVGGKSISFKINIETSIIGAFPYMFSTKKSKLIIPGANPNFRDTYFLNTGEIVQQPNGLLNGKNVAKITGFLEFVERFKDLNDFGLKEKKGYYGYLKNLYINFDMFKSKIEQKNKNIREILLDILNEMSSAVNSFWNFQIVEGELKKTGATQAAELRRNAPFVAAPARGFNPTGGQYTAGVGFGNFNGSVTGGGGVGGTTTTTPIGGNNTTGNSSFISTAAENDIVITVVDENWIGENPDPGGVITFNHSGVGSPFLNATLDISIPAELGAKIINTRLGAVSQTDVKDIKIKPNNTTLFNSETDLFLTRISATSQSFDTTDTTTPGLNEDEVINENARKIAEQEAKIDQSKEPTDGGFRTTTSQGVTVKYPVLLYYDTNGNLIKTTVDGATESYAQLGLTKEEILAAGRAESQATEQRVTSNLEKIDVVPMPIYFKLDTTLKTENVRAEVQKYFWAFCLDDTDFLEKMKIYYFEQKGSGALSQPLPIKYSFTILGNSGIRRGDTFKIDGIPRKYAEKGIFQVTGVEHSLSGMKWETSVEALYRQIE